MLWPKESVCQGLARVRHPLPVCCSFLWALPWSPRWAIRGLGWCRRVLIGKKRSGVRPDKEEGVLALAPFSSTPRVILDQSCPS